MNRRDFLRPSQLARTAEKVTAALREPPPRSPEAELTLLHFSRSAMATRFEVLLPFGTPNAFPLAEAALDQIDELETQLTVYRETSDISRLNRQAVDAPVPVEPQLFGLLTLAQRLSQETDGAFDITAGALIKAWGFFRRAGQVPGEAERVEVLQRVGMRHVMLDAERRSVRFLRAGVEINLGSIGKGYALDRAAELLRSQWDLSAGLLHGGHSSVYAIGSSPTHARGWPVGVKHPWQPERRLALLRLRDRGLATSAATFQHLEYNGRKLGHILDPRRGWPAEGMASVTVTAPTAAEADALATAFFILGVEATRAYCAAHPEIGALLLPDGSARPLAVNIAPDDVELTS
jgi:thiamine biosynthesis lipoprotein